MPSVFSVQPVSIKCAGRDYRASYRHEGGVVHVDSAYGSNAQGASVGKKDPKVVAEQLLGELVARPER